MNIYIVLLPYNGVDSSSDFFGAFSTIDQAKIAVEDGGFTWARIVNHDTMNIEVSGTKEEGFYKWEIRKDCAVGMEHPDAPHMLTALIEKRELERIYLGLEERAKTRVRL